MVLRAAASRSSLSLRAAAISSALAAATSCWFLRKSCALSSRTRSNAAFISLLAVSAAARSRLADSMASAMLFSRVSIIWRMGPQANLPRTTRSNAKVTNVQKLRAKLTSVRLAARTMCGEPPCSGGLVPRPPRSRVGLLDREDDADHLGAEGNSYDERGRYNNRGAAVAGRGGLPGGAPHGCCGQPTKTEAGADDGEAGS